MSQGSHSRLKEMLVLILTIHAISILAYYIPEKASDRVLYYSHENHHGMFVSSEMFVLLQSYCSDYSQDSTDRKTFVQDR